MNCFLYSQVFIASQLDHVGLQCIGNQNQCRLHHQALILNIPCNTRTLVKALIPQKHQPEDSNRSPHRVQGVKLWVMGPYIHARGNIVGKKKGNDTDNRVSLPSHSKWFFGSRLQQSRVALSSNTGCCYWYLDYNLF